jgi:heme/copper-type cytochrome/quinol oxidase subunit 4|tara:strand:+ start:603 stop:1076 length:474 start_codon:yes stop_codon:yes gene_type:complete
MMTEERDAWWGPVALLMLVIAFGMDLLVWQLSGGVEFSLIAERIILGFTLAFGLTSFALLLVSLGAVHRHVRWHEQVVGLLLLTGLGLSLSNWQVEGSFDAMRHEGVILLSGITAMLAAVGLVFGLLLALVTGREHTPDPLLQMESTGGDVSIEIED